MTAVAVHALRPKTLDDIPIQVIQENCVFQICNRLHLLALRPNSYSCNKYLPIKGKAKRLFATLGQFLPSWCFAKLLTIDKRRWRHLEEMWSATMHTVILNWDWDANCVDFDLYESIKTFKVWFLKFILRREDNYALMGKSLKVIASWMQWAALDNPGNSLPKRLPYFLGFDHKSGRPGLPWFGGHLSHYRDIVIRAGNNPISLSAPIIKVLSDRELAILCQMRTFGRALPPPPRSILVDALRKQIGIITSPDSIDQSILKHISEYSQQKFVDLGIEKMSLHTHVSVRLSGEFSTSQSDGGQAKAAIELCQALDSKVSDCFLILEGKEVALYEQTLLWERNILTTTEDDPVEGIYDAFGQLVFETINSFGNELCRDCFYMTHALRSGRKIVSKMLDEELRSPTTGQQLLLCATAASAVHGRFSPEPDNFIRFRAFDTLIPIWYRRTEVTYTPVISPPARIVCLGEPGFKPRALTITTVWLQLILSSIRFQIEPIVARDGRARIGLAFANKLWSFLKYIEKNLDNIFFAQSSDYESATDYIPLSVIKAIWQPLVELSPQYGPLRVFSELIWFPRQLLRPSWDELSDFPENMEHKRGSFMGESLSFITLTMVNLFAEDFSSVLTEQSLTDISYNEMKIRDYVPVVKNPVGITGDDFVAIRFSIGRSSLFRRIANDCGMVFSIGKDGESRRLIIFCEEHALIVDQKSQYIDVVKSRLLTTMARDHSDNRAAIFGKGRTLGVQLEWLTSQSVRKIALCVYYDLFNRRYFGFFDFNQLPWFLPPSLGGLGLPLLEIPDWGHRYLEVLEDIISCDDNEVKYTFFLQLRRISDRNKWGTVYNPRGMRFALDEIKHLHREDFPEPSDRSVIYTLDQIKEILEEERIPVLLDPYTGGPDFEQVKVSARLLGYMPFGDVVDTFDRILTFNEMLTGANLVKEDKTLVFWNRRSSRFWYKHIMPRRNFSKKYVYKDISRIEKQFLNLFEGFIFSERLSELHKYGPSLRLDFKERSEAHSPIIRPVRL